MIICDFRQVDKVLAEYGPSLASPNEVGERTLFWLDRARRLKIRYEHRADIDPAFLQPGCAHISLRFLG